ncbi:hypothetical protein O6H91_Y417800 [Diphasiastrum complanatum]|nr:hypothetical protein O6H91_Y417800 [Diphasiastrum complanatum]
MQQLPLLQKIKSSLSSLLSLFLLDSEVCRIATTHASKRELFPAASFKYREPIASSQGEETERCARLIAISELLQLILCRINEQKGSISFTDVSTKNLIYPSNTGSQ